MQYVYLDGPCYNNGDNTCNRLHVYFYVYIHASIIYMHLGSRINADNDPRAADGRVRSDMPEYAPEWRAHGADICCRVSTFRNGALAQCIVPQSDRLCRYASFCQDIANRQTNKHKLQCGSSEGQIRRVRQQFTSADCLVCILFNDAIFLLKLLHFS